MSQTDMAKLLGAGPTAALWGNYQSYNPKVWKRISVDNALRLRSKTGISLDWVYAGDVRLLPHELLQKLIAELDADREEEPPLNARIND
jgi:hypothetical protein